MVCHLLPVREVEVSSNVNIVYSRIIQIVLDRSEYFLEAVQFSSRWAVDRSNYRV